MAVRYVSNMQEAQAALAAGDTYVFQGRSVGMNTSFATSSGVPSAGLGRTSSSVSGGLGNTFVDAVSMQNEYLQQNRARAEELNALYSPEPVPKADL